MDILTHAISGTAVAACAASFVKTDFAKKTKILLIGTLGGVFPDLDAASMWSQFDSTFGKVFNLAHTGREIYGMKLWYSHHAFFHSLFACALFASLLMLTLYLKGSTAKKDQFKQSSLSKQIIYPVVFMLGYLAHLAGDLPTPSSVWGGVALFWPSKDYVGGFGKIWWWNNYDIFLIILICMLATLALPAISKYIRRKTRLFSTLILVVSLAFILIQVNTRQYDYSYKESTVRYAEMEQNSKKEQERILGKRLYRYMFWFDNKLKFYF